MVVDLQKANLGKRIIAAVFDFILLTILVVGLATLLSGLLQYDSYMADVNDAYARYEAAYGVKFQISIQEYDALTDAQREAYETAYKALIADETVLYAYNMLVNLTLLIVTFSVLISMLALEFVVPLVLGHGQTLGKKIFGIAVMHTEALRVTGVQMFARTVLGKFAIELMIPLSILLLIYFGSMGVIGLVILAVLVLAQILCLAISRNHSVLHDVLASTVTVDISSQRIFNDRDELVAYTKARHAEQAERAEY